MAVNLSMLAGAGAQFFDNNGNPLAGGKLYTYAAGSTTPQATYTTSAGNVQHANPIELDSAGRVPVGGEIWLTDAVNYKFVLTTSADVPLGTYDNVAGNASGVAAGVFATLAASGGSALVGFLQAGAGAVTRTAQSKMRDVVSVFDFMTTGQIADVQAGTALVDVSAAVNAAFIAVNGGALGCKRLYFPRGVYRMNSGISINGLDGLTVFGDGPRSSVLYWPNTAGAMFYIAAYRSCVFYDIGFDAIDFGTPSPARTSVWLRLSGLGGGTELYFQNVQVRGFGTAITTTDHNENDDTITFQSCYFKYHRRVWDNSNTQAVTWSFLECQILYTTEQVFNNPGNYLRAVGGTYINQGTLCNMDNGTAASGVVFQDLHFETTQNFTPPGTPQWLTIGSGNTNSGISCLFQGCFDAGGGAYAGDVFTLRNGFSVTVDSCGFSNGKCNIQANLVAADVTSTITVRNSVFPEIVETLYPGAGNIPVNKVFENVHMPNGTNVRMLATNNFSGSAIRSYDTLDRTYSVQPGQLKVCSVSTIGANPYNKSFEVNIPVNAEFVLSAVDFYYSGGTPQALITLWNDAGKGTKLYEITKASPNTIQVDHKDIDELPNIYNFGSATGPLYLEVTPSGDIGKPTITIVLTLLPVF